MLIIRREQMEAFRKQRVIQFEAAKLTDVAKRFPSWYQEKGSDHALQLIRSGVSKAISYNVTGTKDISEFIDLMIRFGADFDTLDSMAWETEALRDVDIPGNSRMELLLERLGE
jgi:hypothetical protein